MKAYIPNIAWAFRQGELLKLSMGGMVVLAVLAEMANGQMVCWPSIETIARKGRCTPRHARRAVAELAKKTLITLEASAGKVTRYRINRDDTPDKSTRGTKGHGEARPRTNDAGVTPDKSTRGNGADPGQIDQGTPGAFVRGPRTNRPPESLKRTPQEPKERERAQARGAHAQWKSPAFELASDHWAERQQRREAETEVVPWSVLEGRRRNGAG